MIEENPQFISLLWKRALIGTVNNEPKRYYTQLILKESFINNLITNAMTAIAEYCFFRKKPVIDLQFINDEQIRLF